MSTPIDDGGPAFPKIGQQVNFGSGWLEPQDGMTLRDWFAGQALGALIACTDWIPKDDKHTLPLSTRYALQSYMLADAMIAAREGGQGA